MAFERLGKKRVMMLFPPQRWIHALKPVWKSWIARMLCPFLAHVDKRLVDYCDAVVANSRFTAEQVRAVYGREVAGIAYPGVDVEEFSQCNEPKRNLLLTVSHLSGFKRIDFLLEVFARVIHKNPDLCFSIVGDGEKMDDLKRLAEKLSITEHVDFCGRLSMNSEELIRTYSRACLYLHGSIGETFGITLIEALEAAVRSLRTLVAVQKKSLHRVRADCLIRSILKRGPKLFLIFFQQPIAKLRSCAGRGRLISPGKQQPSVLHQ